MLGAKVLKESQVMFRCHITLPMSSILNGLSVITDEAYTIVPIIRRLDPMLNQPHYLAMKAQHLRRNKGQNCPWATALPPRPHAFYPVGRPCIVARYSLRESWAAISCRVPLSGLALLAAIWQSRMYIP